VAASAAAPAGSNDSVLIFGIGDPEDADAGIIPSATEPLTNLEALLQADGYSVTVDNSVSLPADISSYGSIWFIDDDDAVSADDASRLEEFVNTGGGLYLTGERPTICCETLNANDQAIIDSLVVGGGIGVGGTADAVSFDNSEPFSASGVATTPNMLTTWTPSAPGAITGVKASNVLTSTAFPSGTLPTGAAWDGSSLVGGAGRLAILMDINWLESEFWDSATVGPIVQNLAYFLVGGGSTKPTVSPVGSPVGGDSRGAGSPSGPCGCSSAVPDQASVGDPVNTATGDFYESDTDVSLPGAGLPLAFTRTYDAQLAQAQVASGVPAPPLGYGWSDNLGMTVAYDASTQVATVTEENGAQISFSPFVSGTSPAWCTSATSFCSTAPRVDATLNENSGGTWTLVRTTGGQESFTFNSGGTLTSVSDPAGDTITSSGYSPGSGQTVCPSGATCSAWTSSASGRELVLAVNSAGQLVSVFDANSTLAATFTYAGAGCTTWGAGQTADLCSATDPGNQVATFSYDSTNTNAGLAYDLLTSTAPGGSAPTVNGYDSSGRVIQQTQPSSEVITLAYAGTNATAAGGTTTVTTYPLGEGTGNPQDVTVYGYTSNVLTTETTGAGSSSVSTMSIRRDPVSLSPVAVTDGDGNTSSSTYQTYDGSGGTPVSSGNVLTATDGEGNTVQHAYNAFNQAWCSVDAADYTNTVRCPASPPAAPPAPGATDPNPGMTISFYNTSDQLTAQTDALGNTTVYAYTSGVVGVPDGLQYCSVDPVDYQKGVTCPAYGAAHVTGTTTATFDSAGDRLTSTDADGNTTTDVYNVAGHPGLVSSETDPDGTKTSYTYNGAGQVTAQTASFVGYSATTLSAYDSLGNRFCQVAPDEAAKGVTCPTTAPATPPTVGNDPYLGATITTYDANSRPVQVTNPLGGITYTAYDQAGEAFCTVAPAASATGVTCPSTPPATPPTVGNDPYPGATITTYDANGRPVQVTNPLGGITLTVYDAAGNVTQTTVEANNPTSDPDVVTTKTYDQDNRVLTTTVDPNGGVLAATTQSTYDPNGDVYCTVSANVSSTGTPQCPVWQPGWIVAPPSPTELGSDNVTVTIYNADGQQVQSTDPDGHTTISAVDGDGRTYCSADPTNVSAWLSANPSGTYPYLCPTSPPSAPPAQGSNPGYTTTIYDPAGRTVSSSDQVGDTTSHTYTPAGQVLTTTDPRGEVTTNCYYYQNSSGQCAAGAPTGGGTGDDEYATTTPATAADPHGETTTTTYDPGGATDVTTTPAGVNTDGYDPNGDLTSVTYSATAPGYITPANLAYMYNVDGTRHTMVDGTGTTTYTYDVAGDVLTKAFTAASGSELSDQTTAYRYYTSGVLQSITYPAYSGSTDPQVSYTYDATGAMASETDWQGNQVSFTHDQDGNPTGQNNNVTSANPNGTSSTAFAYDNADQTTSATSTLAQTCGGNETLSQTFSSPTAPRNPDGQLTEDVDTYSGSCSGQNGIERDYSYDPAGRVTYQGSAPQGTSPNTFAYDPAGDLTTLSAHDSTGNLDTYTQTYDAAGELTAQTPVSGSQGVATTTSYDSLGDEVRSVPTGSPATSYDYDQQGRLTSVDQGGAGTGFQAVTPARICDTRANNPSGLSGDAAQCNGANNAGDPIGPGGTLNVKVTGTFGSDTIPANAYAVVLDVSVVANTAATYLTAYPGGANRPATTNLDEPAANTVINNQVTVAVGANGQVNLYNEAGSTSVVFDLLGYYQYPTNGVGYNVIAGGPYRICDTRPNNPSHLTGGEAQCDGTNNAGTTLGSGQTLNVQVTGLTDSAGHVISPPAGATAAVVDIWAGDATTATFLVAYPADQPKPATSNVEVTAGGVTTKEVTVPLSSTGAIKIFNEAGSVDLAVQVEGYFTGSGDQYVPITSERICDTRTSNPSGLTGSAAQCNGTNNTGNKIPAGGTLTINVTSLTTGVATPIPANATAIVVNVIALNETTTGWLTLYPAGQTTPLTTTVSYGAANTTVSNETTVGLGSNGQITVYSSAASDVVVDLTGYYIPPPTNTTTYNYNGDGLEASTQPANSQTPNQYTWNTNGNLPLLLSDGTNDYIYGPTDQPVEQLSLTTSTPTYLTYSPSNSTWTSTDEAGDETGYWGYDAYGTLAFGTPTSPFGYSGQYTDPTTEFVYDRARWYQSQTGGFTTRDPDFENTDTAYAYANGDPINRSDPTGDITVGICGGASGIAAFAGVFGIGGTVTDCLERAVGGGDVYLVSTAGAIGVGEGGGVGAGIFFEITSAQSVPDLKGQFSFFTAGDDEIAGLSTTLFWNDSFTIVGADIGYVLGLGAAAGIGRSDTLRPQDLGPWYSPIGAAAILAWDRMHKWASSTVERYLREAEVDIASHIHLCYA